MPDVKAKRPLRDYLRNFYFDTVVHDLGARRFLLDFMGADNLVVGSNYLGWDAVDGFRLVDELNLDERDFRRIAGENAIRLFKLR
jgi:aminocarboxymuconate-semialdehyde decarboxylase